jgi:hypothetical protein
MASFADDLAASLPEGKLALPPEFRLTLEWMEAQGHVHKYRNRDERYGSLYPATLEGCGTSLVTFNACDPDRVDAWVQSEASGLARLAPIIRTGGDGSYAALWLDDDDRQRIVHMGSGSGSVMMSVLCDKPIDMLRLMAIGYDELCWSEQYDMTPEQAREDAGDKDAYVPPHAFKNFIEQTFAVKVPPKASDIVKIFAGLERPSLSDPFWKWLRSFDKKRQ